MFKAKTSWQYRATLTIIIVIAVIAHIIYHLTTMPPKLEECNFPPEDVPIESQQ